MELKQAVQTQSSMWSKQAFFQATWKDFLKLTLNIVIWLGMSLGAYGAIEVIHRGGIDAVRVFMEQHPQVMVLNFIMMLLITSPAMIFKRTHFVSMILCLITGITGCVSSIILSFRGVPLIWSDLYTIGEGLSIADQYVTKELFVKVLIVLLVAIIVLVGVFFIRYKKYGIHIVWRLLLWMSIVAGLLGGIKYIESSGVVEPIAWDVRLSYERNGFVYSFVDSYLQTFREAPNGYGKQTIKQIQDGFVPVTANKQTPNIIMVQLEGIMDPYVLENITYAEDAMANLRAVGEEQVMGYVQVPTLGGGTVRSEFEALTGMNIDNLSPGEIPYNSGVLKKGAVESMAHVLAEEGYATTAMHNFQGNFYSRNSVFSTLGFDTFIPMEAMVNLQKLAGVWPRDHVLLDYIQKTIETTEEQDFIYAITVGSHGPYNEGPIPENAIEVSGAIEGDAKAELEIYLQRLKEVDKFVGNLVQYVNSLDEHTVVLMFSDHYPSMKVVDTGVEEKFLVPYVVMDNRTNLKGQMPEVVEAYELGGYLLDLYGIEGGIMHQYQRSYRGQEGYLDGLAQVQYDILFGNKYTSDGKALYEPTHIQIGMNELVIKDVEQQEEAFVVKGSGFNQSSKIYINGQEVTTYYIDAETLQVEGMQEASEVVVKQLGRNNITLLETDVFEIK